VERKKSFQLALLAPLSFPFFLSLSFLFKNIKIINNMDDNDDDNFIHEDNFIMMKLYAADKRHAELIGV